MKIAFYASCLFIALSCYIQAQDLNFKNQKYFIDPNYVSRNSYYHFDDTTLTDEFQDEIYYAACELAKKNNCKEIADIGCGSGYKLLKYFRNYKTVGFEIEPTLNFLLQKYPHRSWQLSDFGREPSMKNFDIIICSDVVEHLVDPDTLLNWINKFNFKYLVISTPDRDLVSLVWGDPADRSQSRSGPPVNLAHVREWKFQEFAQYISQYFDVVQHFNTKQQSWGQVVIAVKKQPGGSRKWNSLNQYHKSK